MYIKGKAGCGKSVLAAHLIEFFKSRGVSTCFYYFNAMEGDQTSEKQFVRTLLFQYMEEHYHAVALTDQLYPLFLKSPKSVASKTSELWTALTQTTSEIEQPVYWILDGIDECEERAHRLIPVLMNIAEKTPHLRVIFLGQPDHNVDEVLLDKAVSIYITPQMVEMDIRTFILAETQNSSILGLPAFRDDVVSALLGRSESMFLWVKLMLDDLKRSITKSDAERRLRKLPHGLPNAYARLLDRLVAQSDSEELKLSQTIFSFLSVARRPLALEEFRYAYAMSPPPSLDPDNLIPESEMKRIIAIRSAGLVEVGYDNKLRLVHSSLRVYLQRPESDWATQPICRVFRVDEREAHCILGTSCLDFLDTDKIYHTDLHLQGIINQQPQDQPFIAYASSYMPYHLLQAQNPSELIRAKLNHFEESGNLMNWAEHWFLSELPEGFNNLGETAEDFSSVVNLHGSEDLKRLIPSFDAAGAVDILGRAAERRTNLYGSEDPRTLRLLVLLEIAKSSDSEAAECTRDQRPQLPRSHRSNIAVLRRSMVTFERSLQNVKNDWIDQSNLLTGALLFLPRSLVVGEAMQATLQRLAHMVLNAAATLPFAIVWSVGRFYEQVGRYEEAERLFRIAVKKAETDWGPNCRAVLRMMCHMGYFMESRRGSYTGALEIYRDLVSREGNALGPGHPETLATANAIGYYYSETGNYEEALVWYQRALDGREKVLGKDHVDTLHTIHNMAAVCKKQGQYEKALEWYQRACDGYEKAYGTEHTYTVGAACQVEKLLGEQGKSYAGNFPLGSEINECTIRR